MIFLNFTFFSFLFFVSLLVWSQNATQIYPFRIITYLRTSHSSYSTYLSNPLLLDSLNSFISLVVLFSSIIVQSLAIWCYLFPFSFILSVSSFGQSFSFTFSFYLIYFLCFLVSVIGFLNSLSLSRLSRSLSCVAKDGFWFEFLSVTCPSNQQASHPVQPTSQPKIKPTNLSTNQRTSHQVHQSVTLEFS